MSAVATRLPVVQGTPEWLDARRDVIGSSDIPVITGNSPYRSSVLDLWAVKTRLLEPEPPDAETQELYDLGHALEDDIAERYTVITGRPLRRANRMLQHPSTEWAAASLDRVSARRGERRIVELKWAPHRRFDGGPEPVPAHVQDQVQWQLMVTGYDVADVAVLHGSHVEVHQVEPSTSYQDDLFYLAQHFRGYMERGERPPIDGSETTRRTLARLHPRELLGMLPATAETDALARDLREAKTVAKAATAREKELANVMRALLGDAAGIDGDGYRVTWTRNADGAKTSWQAVAAAYRSLLDRAHGLVAVAPLDAIEALHTTTTEGARVLRTRYRDEESGKWS